MKNTIITLGLAFVLPISMYAQTIEADSIPENPAMQKATDSKTDVDPYQSGAVQKMEADVLPPPPPPPAQAAPEREVFRVVEQMPRFPGCEQAPTKAEKDKCSQNQMLLFIYEHIKYPAEAKAAGVEGFCVISFTVEPDGSIAEIKILRDIGGGCGEESARVVSLMPNWIPGRAKGIPVPVQFNLPVKFKL